MNWDDMFMELTDVIAKKSRDPSTKIGSAIVDAKHVLVSVGFNGPPSCVDDAAVPHTRPEKYPWYLHSELNAVLFGLQKQKLDGCTIYVNGFPCSRCILVLAQVGIKRVVYGATQPRVCDREDRALTRQIALAAGITLEEYNGTKEAPA